MKAGTKTNNKHKEMVIIEKEDKYFWILLVIFLILSFILQIPSVTENKIISIIIYILRNLIFTGTIVGYSFFCENPNRLKGFGKIISISSIIYFWIRDFLSSKMDLNILTVIIAISIIYSLIRFIKYNEKNKVTIGISLFFVLIFLVYSQRFTQINDSALLYIVMGGFSILTTIISIYLVVKKQSLKNLELSEKICLPILVFGLTAALIITGYYNLNYSLDTSKPIIESHTIVDKQYYHSFRSPDEYKFCFDINNTLVSVEVEASDYNSYEIGDRYQLKYSNGFFNEPYYYAID